MDPKSSAFVIGIVGAAVTLSAYSQTLVSPTQCIGVGLFVLMFGLLVREAQNYRKTDVRENERKKDT
ncbi:hypothetical protein DVH24_037089 [Malus domestica]|uniref:Uncharacterized protein n=1 Tax=Malus domestica TaxID=3750 RepID=A0A498HIH5_MALDO|nr:hypothetical protein DVH24_037089 [Malus domestica]